MSPAHPPLCAILRDVSRHAVGVDTSLKIDGASAAGRGVR